MPLDSAPLRAYEPKDLTLTWVFATMAAVAGLVAATILILKPVFHYRPEEHVQLQNFFHPIRWEFDPAHFFAAPRLQAQPESDLERFRARETILLNTYDWSDEAKSRVRVPIDVAIDQLLERGLPVRKEGARAHE